ncbi:MAG TPA: hypothetical protein VJ890_28260 [Vineibacter sp.]|nr:hypothetical protein [Vineibacter sp.]
MAQPDHAGLPVGRYLAGEGPGDRLAVFAQPADRAQFEAAGAAEQGGSDGGIGCRLAAGDGLGESGLSRQPMGNGIRIGPEGGGEIGRLTAQAAEMLGLAGEIGLIDGSRRI